MSCTPKDIFPFVSDYIRDTGVCPETEEGKELIIRELNQAIPLLMKRLDAKGTLWLWPIPVYGGCFTLPDDCLEVRQAWLDGKSVEQRNDWYEGRLAGGIEATCTSAHTNKNLLPYCTGPDLIDIGDGYAIPTPWPSHERTRLALVAEHEGDAGQSVQVHVINEYGEEIREDLILVKDQLAVVTDSWVTDVRFLRKEVTKGNVKAYVYYPNGIRMGFCQYKARTTVANFRKKKLPRSFPAGCEGTLLIKGKMRFRPVIDETDPLQICDPDAIGFAFMALAAKRRNEIAEYNADLTMAVNELNKELQDSQSRAATAQVQYKFPGNPAGRRCWC